MLYLVSNQKKLFSTFTEASVIDLIEWSKDKTEVEVDTETTGFFNHANQIWTIQIGDRNHQFVIEFSSLSPDEVALINEEIMMNPNITKILHNAKFDIKFLWRHGMDIVNVYDTMLAEIILNAGKDVPKGFYSLYSLGRRYLGIELDKSVRGEIHRHGLTTRVVQYAGDDVRYLSRIKEKQLPELIKLGLANPDDIQDKYTVLGLENRAVIVFAHMEYNGMKLDRGKWDEISDEILNLVQEDLGEMNAMVLADDRFKKWHHNYIDLFSQDRPEMRCTMNWNSPKQKLELLKLIDRNITSTDQRTLDKYKNKIPLIAKMQEYSKHNKLHSAFAKKLPSHVNKHSGRLHTSFWQILATGRVSSKDPNLLQIPSRTELGGKMRTAFVAEGGNKIVGGDYSQMELRVIAHLSRDPVWMEAFHSGEDLHSVLCCKTFDITMDKVRTASHFKPDLKYRDIQKTVNFGLAYGMSEFKLEKNYSFKEFSI
jgi:DNA polymerase-1